MRRVLFITYYFPPSGGPGVQRALKFAKYLPAFGWEPVVLTVDPEDASFPDFDPTLFRDVPDALRVERTAAWDPYALYARLLGKPKQESVGVGFVGEAELTWKLRLGRWLRANLFLPDARAGWVPYAIRRGRDLLERESFDAIFSTGPPHSLHLAAMRLASRSGLPWLADFRDPWTEADYYGLLPLTAPARKLDQRMEHSVLRDADTVTVVSPSMARGLEKRYGRAYEVVWNGYDADDFTSEPVAPSPEFLLTYTGNLNEARNPRALWQALRELNAAVTMPHLRVRLVGHIDPVVLDDARSHGVDALVQTEAYVPHDEAVRLMQQSALLLLLINKVPGAEGIVTGKAYEYLASGRPILGVGPEAGDAGVLLRDCGAGAMFGWDDAAGVGDFIQRHYDAWAGGSPLPGARRDAVETYSRKNQTRCLARLLDQLADGRAAVASNHP